MKKKAKELQQQRRDAQKGGRKTGVGFGGGFGSGSMGRQDSPVIETSNPEPAKPTYKAPRYKL